MRTGNTGERGGGRRMYVSGLNVNVNIIVDMKSAYLFYLFYLGLFEWKSLSGE